MVKRDEFDDPATFGAVSSIFAALGRRNRVRPRKRIGAVLIVGALVGVLVGVLWHSYPREAELRQDKALPIITADAGPFKVAPREPGGMEIPYRDSTVFETLRAERGGERKIENLLPEAEQPLGRDQLFAGLKTELEIEEEPAQIVAAPAAEPDTDTVAPETRFSAMINDDAPAPAAQPITQAASGTPVPAIKPEAINEMARTETAAGVQTYARDTHQPAVAGGGFYVQIASLRSDEAARGAWVQLKNEFNDLAPLGHRVQKAELGERGTYYRLQAGPVGETAARALCATIEQKKPGGCLVIKN